MAIIGNSNTAIYLYPGTGTQLLNGNVTGDAALGDNIYAAVYGPGPYVFSIIVTGNIEAPKTTSLTGGIVLAGPAIITNQGTIAGGAGLLIFGYGYGATTLQNTGLIQGRAGAAVYTYGQANVNNTGRITGNSNGLYLAGGGTVSNTSTGTITGGTGVTDATYYGTANILNAGLITGTTTDGVFALGTVTNSGIITGTQIGVNLYAGGTLTNSAGLISGATAGLAIYGYGNTTTADGPASITNTGTITGTAAGILIGPSHSHATDIFNGAGGKITGGAYAIGAQNTAYTSIGSAGLIAATSGTGIRLATGHIINTGTISGSGASGDGITASGFTYLYNSGQITATNIAAYLSGGATLVDKGGITGGQDAIKFAPGQANHLTLLAGAVISGGVDLYGTLKLSGTAQTGSLNLTQITNASTIAITKNSDWLLSGTASPATKILNNGTISAPTNPGIALTGALAVYNYATITGGISSPGTYVYNAGLISISRGGGTGIALTAQGAYAINTGTITGATGVSLAANTSLYNYGTITGVTAAGAAAIYNYTGATIAGTADGVFLQSGTLADYGLITGATYAVAFAPQNGGTTDRLILSNTATLTGGAFLAGGAIELRAAPAAGTLTTAHYKDASSLIIDPQALWRLNGNLAATIALTNDGTIDETALKNLTIAGPLSGTGTIDLPQHLTLNGPVAATQNLAFTTNETLSLGNPTAFAATLDSFTTADTIDLTGITLANITATHFTGGVLTLSESAGTLTFTFATLINPTNETFSLFADGPGTGITLAPLTLPTTSQTGFLSQIPTPTTTLNAMTLHA